MANKKYSFSEEEIRSAASEASSRTEMMRILGIRQGGGGYQALEFWCRKYGVEPPDGTALSRKNVEGHSWTAMPDDEWFSNHTRRQGPQTRKRLVAHGIPDECSICGQPPVWNGRPLTLQIDHINGDRWDNRIENVRILCPHCHTQTETYANTGKRKARTYCECGKEISRQATRCVACSNNSKK